MRLRNRFFLVGFGVLIFLIITPLLVLYARGFKIDWQNRQLVKTGTLVIKTEPTRAEIFLNDEKHEQVTPTNVRFLLPNDYNIRLEKEGYQSWTKRLSVRSQLVTWANSDRDYIALFLKQPTLEQTWSGIEIKLDSNQIMFLETGQPTRIDVENGEVEKIPQLLAVETINNANLEIQKILTDLSIPIPNFNSGQIIRTDNQIYLILDQVLYLVNEKLERIYAPVNFAFWNSNLRQILYSNDNEIYIYYTDWKNSDLILRSLTPIKNPILNSETGYVFFQNEGKIKSIELDGRDHRNIFTIADGLNEFVLSRDGKKLYTISQTEIKYYTIR